MRILTWAATGISGSRPRWGSPIVATRCTSSTTTSGDARTRKSELTLVPILASPPERAAAWREITGKEIGVTEGDLVEWDLTRDLFRDFRPEAIVHYGEMPSAPYSMRDRDHAVFTQQNNVVNTLNVWAMRELAPDSHLLKLGTIREYGTPNIDIEEGYLEIEHNGRKETILYPKLPAQRSSPRASSSRRRTSWSCAEGCWGVRCRRREASAT
jgi:UDP-sulfoquinovose synthase